MKPVFAIRNAGFNFQEFSFPITSLMALAPASIDQKQLMKFNYHNLSLASWWPENVTAEFKQIPDKEAAPVPDICEWRGASLVLSSRAYECLIALLDSAGEFLPITANGQTYYLFNCLTFGQIDEINSKQDIQNGVFMGVINVRFNSIDIADKAVFKTPFDRCATVFCDDRLKTLVKTNKLTGIEFRDDLADSL
ncbi:MAG: hypothetical protein U5M23_15090 [Marinagarivorans sp.]|nr:hypothetical protein [Marinagarivorans sp.]